MSRVISINRPTLPEGATPILLRDRLADGEGIPLNEAYVVRHFDCAHYDRCLDVAGIGRPHPRDRRKQIWWGSFSCKGCKFCPADAPTIRRAVAEAP